MKHKYLLKIAICLFLISNISFGQTTVTYDFSAGGAVTGLNEASPGITVGGDTNIGFGSFKNSGTANPTISSSQLRLYQNATKGGSIIVYANNGVTITKIVVNASDRTGNAGYIVDGGGTTNLTGGGTYTIDGISATSQVEFFQRDANSSNRIYVDSFEVTYTSSGAPGISLGAVSGNTNEDGTTATFTVVLDAEPASNVVLDVSSGDTGEVIVSPATLTFTNANWDTPQTVTATGVDDGDQDGNVDVTITLTVDDASSDNDYDGLSKTTTVTNGDNDLPDVVISEIMYNTNTPGSDDEWIELYNDDNSSVDINGWELEYAGNSYTFSSATVIPSKGYITIAVGSSNSGSDYKFNADFPFEPDFNTLGHSYYDLVTTTAGGDTNELTNSSATITLKNASAITIDTVTYDDGDLGATTGNLHDGGGNSLEIVDVDADNSLTTSNWRTSSNLGGSPGASITSTWSGATSSVWNLAGNWDNGIPTSTINAIIPVTANRPTAAAAATANKVIVNSQATLIAQDAFSGTVTYQRNLGTTNWYLVSSPVSGEIMTDMRTTNGFNTNGGSEISFAPYVNSEAVADDRWAYFGDTATDALVNGKGYSTSLASSGDISFTGTINTSDVTIALTQGGGSGTNFNLLGNPFTAYINSGTFLTNESADLDSETIWLWDQSGNGGAGEYITKVKNEGFKVAPGQGFFVEASSTNNVTFTEAMQSHDGTDTFLRNSRPEVHIYMNDGTNNKFAKLYYINGTSTGFDNGYDGKLFGGVANTFAIYSHLVSDSQGKNYQVQSLPNSDYENMVVPIGVNAVSGKELTFSTETMNLPSDLKVYLEDKETDTFTRLDESNTNYKVTLSNDLNGIGRFYLHTSRSALKVNDLSIDNISIYKSNASTLTITGVEKGNASIAIFTVLGKKVLTTSFKSNTVNNVDLPALNTGIYIVQLVTEQGKISKKIIIE